MCLVTEMEEKMSERRRVESVLEALELQRDLGDTGLEESIEQWTSLLTHLEDCDEEETR